MAPTLYLMGGSPPCAAVLLTAAAMGIELNRKQINLTEGEHLKPEFLKLNPLHTLPTLEDNGFSVYESRAIIIYLVEKYGKDNNSLYPKSPETRASIHRLMHYDNTTLYGNLAAYYYPQTFQKAPADPEKLKKLKEALEYLNNELAGKTYLTGNDLTVADLSMAASVATTEVFDLDMSEFSNVTAWMDQMKKLPYYKENCQNGVDGFKSYVKSLK